jgi:hypothetical protein
MFGSTATGSRFHLARSPPSRQAPLGGFAGVGSPDAHRQGLSWATFGSPAECFYSRIIVYLCTLAIITSRRGHAANHPRDFTDRLLFLETASDASHQPPPLASLPRAVSCI